LEATINAITKYGNLKQAAELYDERSIEDQSIIETTIIRYMNAFNVALIEIIDNLPDILANSATKKKDDAMNKDIEMKNKALEKVCPTISQQDKIKSIKRLANEFGTKGRINTSMSNDKDEIERLKKNTIKRIQMFLKNYRLPQLKNGLQTKMEMMKIRLRKIKKKVKLVLDHVLSKENLPSPSLEMNVEDLNVVGSH